MKFLVTFGLLICFVACTNSKGNSTQTLQKENKVAMISRDDISKIDYIEFVLDSKAEKVFETWANYLELENLITNLKQGDLSFFKDNEALLLAFVEDFKATVPEEINSPPIQVRIKALETKIYKLESAATLSTTSKEDMITSIKELLIAVSNFKLQINKKFEKESQNIQKP